MSSLRYCESDASASSFASRSFCSRYIPNNFLFGRFELRNASNSRSDGRLPPARGSPAADDPLDVAARARACSSASSSAGVCGAETAPVFAPVGIPAALGSSGGVYGVSFGPITIGFGPPRRIGPSDFTATGAALVASTVAFGFTTGAPPFGSSALAAAASASCSSAKLCAARPSAAAARASAFFASWSFSSARSSSPSFVNVSMPALAAEPKIIPQPMFYTPLTILL